MRASFRSIIIFYCIEVVIVHAVTVFSAAIWYVALILERGFDVTQHTSNHFAPNNSKRKQKQQQQK